MLPCFGWLLFPCQTWRQMKEEVLPSPPRGPQREALSGLSPSPPHSTTHWPLWASRVWDSSCCKSSASKQKQGLTFGVTVIFTLILFKRGRCVLKVQKVHMSFSRPATRGTMPDTVPSKTYSTWRAGFFVCFLFFFAAPFWFTGLQLKQFARHKCYDKTLWIYSSDFFLFVQYQTQGTLIGLLHLEKPLLFGIVPESQNQPIPLRVQSLMGVAVVCSEEVCTFQSSNLTTVFCMHSSTATASSVQSCSNSFQELAIWKKVLKRGISSRSSKIFCCCVQTSQK